MKYKVQDSDEVVDGEILEKLSQDEYKIKIKDNEYVVKILHTDSNVMEFVLNNEFHSVRYVDSQTSEMNFIVDGSSMSVNMNSHLDDIVFKNSGGSDSSSGQSTLRSQIPGKVVSIDVEDGAEVKKGDTVCTLESMKMQVAVKAQKDGIVKGIKIKGSVEAILGALENLATGEVGVNVLHSGVGGINESDITLANASGALIIGFNVRANHQAREMARQDDVEIRYYSIIYDLTDDLKKALSGMLAPTLKENLLGYAEIREVFHVSKVGKVAGCIVTEGMVKRGAKVRLVRDEVVIHEGELSQLKRFKDDAKEVKGGIECGMAFANYQDIQIGDMIECFEIEEIARAL
uniref:Translation initiation factor IF-2 (InfB, MTIF2) n=1 Tax=uncultured marine thaumarchaeote KM3_46_G10 TaxID=1456161 RepID=A0A075HA18_9ARCH|nr:translation initiation factor IF-2 (infB, MTIF2) [uncultured marine thaumarchaeote KM3_46_G10]